MDIHFFEKITLKEIPLCYVNFHNCILIIQGAPSAVYYPPGDLYSADSQQSEPILTERKKKDRSDKKTRNDGDYGNTQGAAVVPICLPLCCAAPCVIL